MVITHASNGQAPEPKLAWPFNRDGEVNPELLERRDRQMGINSSEKRKDRQDLVDMANPQMGVDALKDALPGPTESIPGVRDSGTDDPAD
ncbi:DUF1264 domain-containing protein [Marinobacter segnicrescens]|uniref:DUF1264 domain-containing protein n=1 Tax=Marinobacter segnicrescens TaxID=430453 RepID=UPI003A91449D